MKWLHSLAYIIWIGYFSKKVRDFIIEEELTPPSRKDSPKKDNGVSSAITNELNSLFDNKSKAEKAGSPLDKEHCFNCPEFRFLSGHKNVRRISDFDLPL